MLALALTSMWSQPRMESKPSPGSFHCGSDAAPSEGWPRAAAKTKSGVACAQRRGQAVDRAKSGLAASTAPAKWEFQGQWGRAFGVQDFPEPCCGAGKTTWACTVGPEAVAVAPHQSCPFFLPGRPPRLFAAACDNLGSNQVASFARIGRGLNSASSGAIL